jgi:hypothetical protein
MEYLIVFNVAAMMISVRVDHRPLSSKRITAQNTALTLDSSVSDHYALSVSTWLSGYTVPTGKPRLRKSATEDGFFRRVGKKCRVNRNCR